MRHVESNSYTRMYISRRKCEMVACSGKKHHPVARAVARVVARGFWVVARVLLGGC